MMNDELGTDRPRTAQVPPGKGVLQSGIVSSIIHHSSFIIRHSPFFILLSAGLLRFLFLGSNPAGVFRDEAEKGYSSYCLLKVGGVFDFAPPPAAAPQPGAPHAPLLRRWPLFVDVWGSTTSMICQYAALPFVAAGGLNAWTVRLPSAIVGTLTVLLVFLLARTLSGRGDVATWAAAFTAFSPWHVVFSRWALQGIFVPFFVCGGLLAFLGSLEAAPQEAAAPQKAASSSRRVARGRAAGLLTLSALCFGLAFYSYAGAQPFLLLFWPLAALVWRKPILARWKACLWALPVFALILVPTLFVTFGGGGAGMGRFSALSVFGMEAPFSSRLLLFLRNYLSHFSPQFLFLTGDTLPRHGFPGFGVMLHVEAVFLIAGIYTALRGAKARGAKTDGAKVGGHAPAYRFLLGWFLLFPFSAALTNEGIPHALRTLHAVPCPQILSAMGAVAALEWLRGKWGVWARRTAVALVSLDAAAVVFVLFLVYPRWSAESFEYGIREGVEMAWGKQTGPAPERRGNLHVLVGGVLTGVPELYYFHLRVPPRDILERGFDGAPLREYPPHATPEKVLEQLRPGDAFLMSSGAYPAFAPALHPGALSRNGGFRTRPILLPNGFLLNEPSEILRLVQR